MNYLKKELNKLMPYALLYGAIGGILLILVNNLFAPSILITSLIYFAVIGLSVYLLNILRFRRDTKGSILYGYLIYAIMTVISFVDTIMNVKDSFYNPMFEQTWIFAIISVGVLFLSGAVSFISNRRTFS